MEHIIALNSFTAHPYGVSNEDFSKKAAKMAKEHLSDPEKAKALFIKMGLLNPDGTKSKNYYDDGK